MAHKTDVVNPDLKTAPLTQFHEDPHNARRHPSRNMAAIKGSLARYGQQKPIVVKPDGTIIAGNGTWRALCEMGWTKVGYVTYSGPAEGAAGYGVADNRGAELAEWDTAILQDIMHALPDADWEASGWTQDELRSTTGQLPSASAPTGDSGTLSHEGAETGRTPDDKLDTFMNNTLRQVVLIYPVEDHTRVVAALAQVAKDLGLASNTDVVDYLLESYARGKF